MRSHVDTYGKYDSLKAVLRAVNKCAWRAKAYALARIRVSQQTELLFFVFCAGAESCGTISGLYSCKIHVRLNCGTDDVIDVL